MTVPPSNPTTSAIAAGRLIRPPAGRSIRPPAEPQGLSEAVFVVVAAAAWLGADVGWWPVRSWLPLLLLIAPVLRSLKRRRPLTLLIATFLLCSYLGSAADNAYRPIAPGPIEGPVTVLSDPERSGFGLRVELRLQTGDRIEATAYGRAAGELQRTAVGETLAVDGRVRSVGQRGWLRSRHITGLATIERAEVIGEPGLLRRIPEFFRDRIADGAATMSHERRSLYLGLVIGDDREQSLGQRLRFRAAGLTHLLAVSGQNVAFVLVVARPLLQLFGYRGRFVALLAILLTFALITRLEPSVLRATATASIAAWAALSGRERSGLKVLSLAVVVVICLDPFLVDSVGFQLSVAASGGILLAQQALQSRLPGPDWLTGPLATTLAAQAGVSPLLAVHFGPVSLASVPANLLAGWAAAAIMTIGLTTGVLAGLSPEPAAAIIQAPAGVLLWWIELVATSHARLPAPLLGPIQVAGLVGLAAATRSPGAWRPVRWGCLALALLVLAAAVPRSNTPSVCGPGVVWYPRHDGHPSVLVMTADAYDRSIEQCVASGIRRVDLLLLERGNATAARLVTAIDELVFVGAIVAPPQHRVIGAQRRLERLRVETGFGVLVARPTGDGLTLLIDVEPNAPTGPSPR